MTTVQQILDSKGHGVHAVATDAMVLEALKLMAEENIGSVMVMDGERVAGIFTERLYARKVFLEGRAAPTTPIRDVMNTEVPLVRPEQSADACMALMTDKRIRHLPVMQEDRLVGLISIGDLMKSAIDERQFHIDQLVEYVGR